MPGLGRQDAAFASVHGIPRVAPGAGAPGSTLRLLALAALLSRFVLTAALLTTLVATALVLAALAGLRLGLVRLLLTTLIGICLVHALLLLLHINQTSSSNGMFPAQNNGAARVRLHQMTHLALFKGDRLAFDVSNSIGTGRASGEDGINHEIFCSA
jgi:hypothetical protein